MLDKPHFAALSSLFIVTIMLIPMIIIMYRFKRMRFISGVLGVILASFVILMCIFYPDVQLLYAHPSGDPIESADLFLKTLSEGRIADGYDALYGTDTMSIYASADRSAKDASPHYLSTVFSCVDARILSAKSLID